MMKSVAIAVLCAAFLVYHCRGETPKYGDRKISEGLRARSDRHLEQRSNENTHTRFAESSATGYRHVRAEEDMTLDSKAAWAKRERGVEKREVEEEAEEEEEEEEGEEEEGEEEHQYVVVFDAGSTGTRVHIYQFEMDEHGPFLIDEVYEKVKPGLSSYEDEPEQAADSVQTLIARAQEVVPENLQSSTPVLFQATAGLRLLDPSSAQDILDEVTERLEATNFLFNPSTDISIISGIEEAFFGWTTVNFLLGYLNFNLSTSAVLDMGGGSVQVAYEPYYLGDADLNYLWWESLFGKHYYLLLYSYLGNGLKAARNATLFDYGDGSRFSYCLPVGYTGTFTYGGVEYNVRGPSSLSMGQCWQQNLDFLAACGFFNNPNPMADFLSNPNYPGIYLFSYFFDVLQWAGVIGSDVTKTTVHVSDYLDAGEAACMAGDVDEPFLCQDLSYISALLQNALQLSNVPLNVVSQIYGTETSWTLGAALYTMSRMELEE